ncbi:SOH1-domain-containing protein [Piedraia hortae CBS 480.64]|uniref:Mediator of RNA polymerase II transcription subunit 31 n=1 Tax=Piedraia hortae CBS 480.64 TaxID=1314780 RepID=A0A6A7BUX1_9PEZI|nr:SOH1-domain-containing protein [Piedraia hortae CBS 480.64]
MANDEPSRFEVELEFVQSLSNPLYIQWLSTMKILDAPEFVEYVKYLCYFRRPEYIRYLARYPGPTIRILELLQQEQFRKDIINPTVVEKMMNEGMEFYAPPDESA